MFSVARRAAGRSLGFARSAMEPRVVTTSATQGAAAAAAAPAMKPDTASTITSRVSASIVRSVLVLRARGVGRPLGAISRLCARTAAGWKCYQLFLVRSGACCGRESSKSGRVALLVALRASRGNDRCNRDA